MLCPQSPHARPGGRAPSTLSEPVPRYTQSDFQFSASIVELSTRDPRTGSSRAYCSGLLIHRLATMSSTRSNLGLPHIRFIILAADTQFRGRTGSTSRTVPSRDFARCVDPSPHRTHLGGRNHGEPAGPSNNRDLCHWSRRPRGCDFSCYRLGYLSPRLPCRIVDSPRLRTQARARRLLGSSMRRPRRLAIDPIVVFLCLSPAAPLARGLTKTARSSGCILLSPLYRPEGITGLSSSPAELEVDRVLLPEFCYDLDSALRSATRVAAISRYLFS